jgi:thiamine-phosphate pyrophosphorylase
MRLYVLLTQEHCPIPLLDAAQRVIRGGADVVQLREKRGADREILELGRKLRDMTGKAGVGFILNDRADLARLIEADGVHLGQTDLPPAAARCALKPGQVIGLSTHSPAQARAAQSAGVDYIGVGPVYPTATKGYEQGVGIEYLRAAAQIVPLPLVAIGGITLARAPEVAAALPPGRGALAVCSAVLGAPNIEAATAAFKAALLATAR